MATLQIYELPLNELVLEILRIPALLGCKNCVVGKLNAKSVERSKILYVLLIRNYYVEKY
jgi:hypothetical protein